MTTSSLALGPFLHELEERLDALSAEELRARLIAHGEGLPSKERAGFLAMFEGGAPRRQDDPDDPTLVTDVEEFVSNIAGGVYVDTWGYDRDYGDHRAFGDEGWTFEFDHLLDRAGRALRNDDAATARQAFRGLLVALGDEHDEGGFPGAGSPDELVDSDLEEARHRYLRAVWEDEPVETRAMAVVTAAEEVCWVRGDPSLAELEATLPVPLPDLDEVLDDLVDVLQAAPSGYGFGRQARQWLAEVTQRHRGVDGLAELARTPGPDQAEAYRDWMDALVQAGKLTDAEVAGREALDRLDPHGRTVALVAERLAVLAMAREDDDAVLDAQRHAWRADPTLERLLGLVDIASALDQRADVLAAEADRAGEEPLASRPDLAAAVLLLDDRPASAENLLAVADPLGWRYERHLGPVVLPFLLVASSRAPEHEAWGDSLLLELLDRANNAGPRHGLATGEPELTPFREMVTGEPGRPEHYRAIPQDELLLSTLLLEAGRTSTVVDEPRRWLATASGHVDVRVEAVVSGKHRSGYAGAAHLVAASAEAVLLVDGAAAAGQLVDGFHTRYPRHSLFRRELREVVARSPLLPA